MELPQIFPLSGASKLFVIGVGETVGTLVGVLVGFEVGDEVENALGGAGGN